MTSTEVREQLCEYSRAKRLQIGLTQQELAERSGVSLATLRKFEQQGSLSLTSFLKLASVLGFLDALVTAVRPASPPNAQFSSIDDVLAAGQQQKQQQRARRK